MALAGTPPLTLRVLRREDSVTPDRYKLTPVPRAECVFEFMAPHNDVGKRFDNLPTVDAAGVVKATHPGVYLFQVRRGDEYIVGRLQVHNAMVGWWFGNDSITTAKDVFDAHAQPSIYARFSDDPTGTDLIGDITGHGYVTLTSGDPLKIEVTPDGRLRGIAETISPVGISGTSPGLPSPLPLRAHVVDYAKHRRDLRPVQEADLGRAQDMHNIIFIPEGFTEAQEELFNKVVSRTVKQIFNQRRHQPYPMLEGSFNIFKAFIPSRQETLTCGFRVTDTDGPPKRGAPIPYNDHFGGDKAPIYTLEELVAIVGLPKRGENRQNLKGIWAAQGLTGFEPDRVSDKLLNAWKGHQAAGILNARDTVFGLQLGRRWADRGSGTSDPVVTRPATDTPGDPMKAFVARVYEFYSTVSTRQITPDPRRHAPEAQALNATNPGNSIVAYLKGLDYAFPPFPNIGTVWEPDAGNFKPSRGLVAIIAYDGMEGGTNFNNNTLTALTMDGIKRLRFDYADQNGRLEMRRRPPDKIKPDFQNIADTVAHEFGHSFNLGDEYETFGRDAPTAGSAGDFRFDNLTRLGFVRHGAPPSREIDPGKVKWLGLPRMRVSARLIAPSQPVAGGIKVTIDRRYMSHWVKAHAQQAEVHLRNFSVSAAGRQLPLETDPEEYLTGLKISTPPDVAQGVITLTGTQIPPVDPPEFAIGSVLFVPLKDQQGQPITVVEKKVLEHLNTGHTVLNQDPDIEIPNDDADYPVQITGFKPPCKSAKLIGIYEGGAEYAGGVYRPTGNCKMRNEHDQDYGGDFCYVCKWLIVNRVDPGYHSIISGRFYPKARKSG